MKLLTDSDAKSVPKDFVRPASPDTDGRRICYERVDPQRRRWLHTDMPSIELDNGNSEGCQHDLPPSVRPAVVDTSHSPAPCGAQCCLLAVR